MDDDRMHKLEIEMTEIKGDVKRIGERLDNGISKTITKLDTKFDEFMLKFHGEIMPAITDSKYWIEKLKFALVIVVFVGILRIVWEHVTKIFP